MEKGIRRENKGIIVLVAILLVLTGVAVFNWLSTRWEAQRFSSTRLFFTNGVVIYSYEFPKTKAVVADDYRPEAENAFCVKHPTGLSSFGDVATSEEGRYLHFLYKDDVYEISPAEDMPQTSKIYKLDLSTGIEEVFLKLPESLVGSRSFALSPDYKYAVFVVMAERDKRLFQGPRKHVPELEINTTYKFQIYIMEIETLEYSRIEDDADETRPCWFPDSRGILYGARDRIYKYDLSNGTSELMREGSFPSLSPDGSMLAYFHDGRFCWVRVDSETPEHPFQYQRLLDMTWFEAGIEPVSVWSPDGKYLLLSIWGEFTFTTRFPFFGPLPWEKLFILDAETGRIVYKDKILAPLDNAIIWVRKNDLTPSS